MARKNFAFTLPELLVVLAILMILASVIFPVFKAVKSSAYKTTCISNFKQVQLASTLYVADWDDRLMPVNHQPSAPANSQNDRTWVQLTLPYAKKFSIFNCPSDTGNRPSAETTFDQDLVPGDTNTRYYSASLRVNTGYNYAYLAPVFQSADGRWQSDPRSATSIAEPSKTLFFVDTVWGRTESGTPFGGGSWLVVPPCRFSESVNGRPVDSWSIGFNSKIFAATNGWKNDQDSPFVYGSAWPWHDGKINLIRVDGSAGTISPNQLSAGCVVKENWQGIIKDNAAYIWDLN